MAIKLTKMNIAIAPISPPLFWAKIVSCGIFEAWMLGFNIL